MKLVANSNRWLDAGIPGRVLSLLPGSVMLMLVTAWTTAADLTKLRLEPTFELSAGTGTAPVPLRWAGGWVLAQVKLNGVDAGWFKLATGWRHSVIDPAVAARLGLPEVPEFGLLNQVPQSGSAPRATRIFRADLVECGPAAAKDVHLQHTDLAGLSQEALKMHGEGISGVLGWDLLRTLPFVLDEPALQLEWRREAAPADGAIRLPLTESHGCPWVAVTLGGNCQARAMVNTAAVAVVVQRPFLTRQTDALWDGQAIAGGSTFFVGRADDDNLPVGPLIQRRSSSRWLAVACGGEPELLPVTLSPGTNPAFGEVQLGYGWLRRRQVWFDGPGKALWAMPAATVPEIAVAGQRQPAPSHYLLTSALGAAVDFNDPIAVRALAAAGADLKGLPKQEPLPRACANGAREAAAALIKAGAPVEPPPSQSATPLLSACESGDPELITMLLEKGADANRGNATGFTPLEAAARSGSTAAVEALRGQARFPSDAGPAIRVLGEAAAGGNLALAREMLAKVPEDLRPGLEWSLILEQTLLLGHPAPTDWLLKSGGPGLATERTRMPPLLAAILPTRIEKTDAVRERLVAMLLAAGADPNADCNGITPLLLAARHGSAGIIQQLLAAGAKATATDFRQRNALLRAAAANQPAEVIAPLLKAGLELEVVDAGTECTALATYAQHGNRAACRALLAAGAVPDGRSLFGVSPLALAANGAESSDGDALAVVKLLLDGGAAVTTAAGDGEDPGPLFGACVASRASLIKPLVEAGAPLEKKFANATPLGWACAMSAPATVKALLECGADPRATDRIGVTPLCHAAAAGRVGNLLDLLERGVSPDAAGPQGMPPIWLATACGQTRAVRLLLAAGARADASHPERKTTALEVARSRGDQTLVDILTIK